ncbi:hypothetical protein F4Z99_19235 [Candidatus Poribacteria bacterium]|nr:hypothetical protein [Candidatus Poribacteria bacterium]MYB00390.1 hypothetical protein [Candidatus Poribacteria bacterium]
MDSKFKIPSKEEVEAKMKQVLPEPEHVDVSFPSKLEDCDNFQMQMLEWDTKDFRMPQIWNLRPNRYPNIEALLKEVAELPIALASTFWENSNNDVPYPTPQVVSGDPPFRSYFLGPEKEDMTVVDGEIVGRYRKTPFDYRGRIITPNNNHTWAISAIHEMFVWEFGTVPTNPTVEWILKGDLYEDESRRTLSSSYPRLGFQDPNLPNWRRPLSLLIDIASEAVYGTAWLGLKQLGFWGGLDVAINFIEGVEWAYAVAEKPEYLSDEDSTTVVEVDPVMKAVKQLKDTGSRSDFTKSGKPKVRPTSKIAGQKVTAKQRDAAWEQVKKDS